MHRRLFFEMTGVASVALGLSKAASAQAGFGAEARLKALGTNALPSNAAVEIESIWEIRE